MYVGDSEVTGTVATPAFGDPFIVSPTAPVPALAGMGWLDTTTRQVKVFDGRKWISVSAAGLPPARTANDILVSTAAGNNWVAGDLDDGRF